METVLYRSSFPNWYCSRNSVAISDPDFMYAANRLGSFPELNDPAPRVSDKLLKKPFTLMLPFSSKTSINCGSVLH